MITRATQGQPNLFAITQGRKYLISCFAVAHSLPVCFCVPRATRITLHSLTSHFTFTDKTHLQNHQTMGGFFSRGTRLRTYRKPLESAAVVVVNLLPQFKAVSVGLSAPPLTYTYRTFPSFPFLESSFLVPLTRQQPTSTTQAGPPHKPEVHLENPTLRPKPSWARIRTRTA